MKNYKLIIRYRWRYYKKKIFHFIGFCPECKNKVNYTSKGRPICPNCAK